MPLARRTDDDRAEPRDDRQAALTGPGGLAAEELSEAVLRALHRPLEALRACLESLSDELSPADPRGAVAHSAEQEVERLVRRGRLLTEYLGAPRPRPLRCSIDEVVYAARRFLPAELQSRTWLALDAGDHHFVVDGPLLSHALAHLIENGFEAGSERVLVRGRREGGEIELAVVDRAGDGELDLGRALQPFHTTKHGRLGLGLTLAARDVGALSGTLRLEESPNGETCFRIRVPEAPPEGDTR